MAMITALAMEGPPAHIFKNMSLKLATLLTLQQGVRDRRSALAAPGALAEDLSCTAAAA